MLCESYEVVLSSTTRMFRMTIAGSAVTLFDIHFSLDASTWPQVDTLFSNWSYSITKQEDVSDDLVSRRIATFRKDRDSDKDVLRRLISQISTLHLLAWQSDQNDIVLRRLLPSALRGAEWALHADKCCGNEETYQSLVYKLITSITIV